MMTVRNMTSARSGREVANQFVIEDLGKWVFQSYETPIASYNAQTRICKVNVDYFNYSMTTSKYFNQFVSEWLSGETDIKALKKALNSGKEYKGSWITFVPLSNDEFMRG